MSNLFHALARERVILGAVALALLQYVANGGELTWEALATVAAGAVLSCLVSPSKPGIRRTR